MNILFTGASSFTGSWIVPALARAGHQVTVAFTRGGPDEYEGLRKERVLHVLPHARAVWAVESGDERFVRLCHDQGPWDLLCLHGAEVGDYRAPAFDWQHALTKNTRGYARMFAAFSAAGGRAVALSGSYFEADEGNPTGPAETVSSYGLSKTLTWHVCRHECLRAGLVLGKFVIPNPVGPFEEPKLVAFLTRAWRTGGVPYLRTPLEICDNLPVNLLAAEYVDFVAALSSGRAGVAAICRPSGWVESVESFSRRVAREFGRLSGVSFPVTVDSKNTRQKSTTRCNTTGRTFTFPVGVAGGFWREWHDFYFAGSGAGREISLCHAARAHAP